jgi:hypothetical protein
MTSDQVFAAKMGGTWMGGLAIVRLVFELRANTSYSIDLALHHGRAGGKRRGASFNQIEEFSWAFDADMYFMGHNHDAGCLPGRGRIGIADRHMDPDADILENVGTKSKEPWLYRTGTFNKSYRAGHSNYAVKNLYMPAQLGTMEASVEFRRTRKNGDDRIIHKLNGQVVQ